MSTPLNCVTIVAHDLGQQLGCYGHPDARTPNVDRLAAEGRLFSNSFCTAPQCSPSRASLWTGRYPHATGVVGLTHGGFANDLNGGEKHLAQVLCEAGYTTHLAHIQHCASSPQRCGFQHHRPGGHAPQTAKAAVEVIEGWRSADGPLMLQVGFFEPHRPFPHDDTDVPSPADMVVPGYLPDLPVVREDLALMAASAASMDAGVGRILDALDRRGLTDSTVVLFVADHGIPFPHAKMTLYDPGLQVATLLRVPGLPGGRRHEQMVSNVDVLPTLLELLGLEAPAGVQGRSFRNLLVGDAYRARNEVFGEMTYHTYYDPMRCIRTDRWKLIANFEHSPYQMGSPDYHNNAHGYYEVAVASRERIAAWCHPPFELYDLAADPWEQQSIADAPEHQATRDDLARRLRRWMAQTGDPLLYGPVAQGAYRQRMAAFRAL